jgi:type I restriction enzyme R subunit
MAFSAWKLLHCPEAENPSIFVMVDRKELEEQIEKDFSFLEIPVERVDSIKKLIEILKWGKEGKRGIFLVTIEKFSPKEFAQLKREEARIEIERENVVVLADEVHRTHYGKFAILMRSVFKNAFIFGFTGTPLSKIERNTFQKFCPKREFYLDRYSMIDAQEDGFTVPLSYQAKLPQYHLNRQQLKEFSKFEEEKIETLSLEEKRELKRKVRPIEAIVKKPERVKNIAKSMAEHFKEIVEITELKGMIVTVDREACVLYKNAIDEFLPQNYSEVVMTFDPNKKIIRDYFKILQDRYNIKDMKEIQGKIIEDFRTKKEPKILIVTDMLITGFDAPNLWTMYLDKPLKEHRILQAIARTNRPFLNKKFGLIVDYIGVLAELEKAFEKFESDDARALKTVIRNLEKEKQTFKELLERALKIFEKVKKEDTHESLENALNQLINPENARNFEAVTKELMRSYEMLSGEPFLSDYLADYMWVIKIYVAYYRRFKKTNVDELKIESLSKKTINLVQQTIDVKEIEGMYPTVTIDERYIENLRKSAARTMGAAIDVIANVQHEARLHQGSPFFINLSRQVEETYEGLRTRKIETEEAIKRLLNTCEKIAEWKREEEEIGKDRYLIYEALKEALPHIEKQKAIDFVNFLLAYLEKKNLLFKGWRLQRDVRRRVKAEMRIQLLSKFRNYRDKVDDIAEKIFQALEGLI